MKKLILLALFFSANFISNAQEWAPIGTEWYYHQTFAFTGDTSFNHWEVVGDTIINGQSCRIIQKTRGTCDIRPVRELMYGENRRIYFYNAVTEDFEILYDFNLEAGDSYTLPLWFEDDNWNMADTAVVNIDSVSTFVWNDSTYKVQYGAVVYFDGLGPAWRYFEAIENIGGTNSMFNVIPGICDAAFDSGLRCFNSGVTGLIQFGTLACDYTTPVKEIHSVQPFQIYPNPAGDRLIIEGENLDIGDWTYKVMNTSGQILLAGNIEALRNEIQLSSIPPGIYFIQVFQSDQAILTEKLVKM